MGADEDELGISSLKALWILHRS